jgi:hypothetical protein
MMNASMKNARRTNARTMAIQMLSTMSRTAL